MKTKNNFKKLLMAFIMLPAMFISCKKDVAPAQIVDEDATSNRTLYSSRSVNWNRSDGTYTSSQATSDFGEYSGTWHNADIYSDQCRIRIPANSLSSGNIVNINVPDGTEYQLSFRVRFGPSFEWSRGGKLGFGFLIGDGNTGCDKADDGNGGSARIMWYNNNKDDGSGSDAPYFRPYVYYKDMPETCGNNFGKQSKTLNKNQWYTVTIRVKSNTGSSTNGNVTYTVDGVTLLNQTLRWTTNTSKQNIREISFHTFRGGSDPYWQSDSDGLVYYDDLSWSRISS